MLLLAIDTASTTSVAIVTAPDTIASETKASANAPVTVLAARTTDSTTDHAEQLSAAVAQVLEEADVAPAQLSAIIVGVGPGPFTGLRIGMVAAAAYGYGWDKPVHGVMSLDALALPAAYALAQQSCAPQTEFLVAADARRREVYWAHYRTAADGAHPELLAGPGVGAADQLPEHLRALPAFGPGVQLYPQAFANPLVQPTTTQHSQDTEHSTDTEHGPAAQLALRAAAQLSNAPDQLLPLVPLYLRESDAKLPTDKKWARNV